MSLLTKFRQWRRERRVIKDCGCICWCKNCGNILNDNSECTGLGKPVITYTCNDCGYESKFDFWIAPVPIFVSCVQTGRDKNG